MQIRSSREIFKNNFRKASNKPNCISDYGTTEWFPIQTSVKYGCVLSPGLFNLYIEYITKTGGIGDMVTGFGKVT